MNITSKQLVVLFISILGIIDIATLVSFNSIVTNILIFLFILILPGLIILSLFNFSVKSFFWYLTNAIGLSVCFLIVTGLISNSFFSLFGTNNGLSKIPILVVSNILLLGLLFLFFRKRKRDVYNIKLPNLNQYERILVLILISLPLLSILGVMQLNLANNNIIVIALIIIISIILVAFIPLIRKIRPGIYPFVLISIALSVLLLFSLRSGHIIGFDINEEFEVFRLTLINSHWSMDNLNHAYNACLSITILPTVINVFIQINPEYIYKLIFPLIFCISPVLVYLISKHFVNSHIAFYSGILFLIQSNFILEMPSLARQEIALIFFGLLILTLLDTELKTSVKIILGIIYGISMSVSHYSTTYIGIALLIFTYGIYYLLFLTRKYLKLGKYMKNLLHPEKNMRLIVAINGIIIITITVFSIFWYFQITNSASNVSEFAQKTVLNMGDLFSDMKNPTVVSTILGNAPQTYRTVDVIAYQKDLEATYSLKNFERYSLNNTNLYSARATYPDSIPPKNYLNLRITFTIHKILLNIFKFLILIGLIYLILSSTVIQNRLMLIILAVGFVLLLALIVILPHFSIMYNLDRLLQQALIILALIIIIGLWGLLDIFKVKNKKVIITIYLILYFIFVGSYVIYQFVGGSPIIIYNNFGEDYDKFYTHESELLALDWTARNNDGSSIYMERYSALRAYAFSNISRSQIVKDIVPTVINKNAYVFSGYVNTNYERVFVQHNHRVISYNFPHDFLQQNKNVVYNSGNSEVYR
jgi:uncharacterized membrane protein